MALSSMKTRPVGPETHNKSDQREIMSGHELSLYGLYK